MKEFINNPAIAKILSHVIYLKTNSFYDIDGKDLSEELQFGKERKLASQLVIQINRELIHNKKIGQQKKVKRNKNNKQNFQI